MKNLLRYGQVLGTHHCLSPATLTKKGEQSDNKRKKELDQSATISCSLMQCMSQKIDVFAVRASIKRETVLVASG